MKLILFNYKQFSRGRHKDQKLNIERLLFLSCIIVFILMLFVQAALTSPSVRTFLNGQSTLEGQPLGVEEYMYAQGILGLQLISSQSNSELKILLNGEQFEVFNENVVNLSVKNGDVIEIDGSSVMGENEVKIVSKSTNITNNCLNKNIKVNGNIKQLIKVTVK